MALRFALVGLFAASLLAGTGAQPAASGADEVGAQRAYTVKATVEARRVVEDEDFVVVKGRVIPKAVGQVVTVQQRMAGSRRWKNTGRVRIDRDGRFYFSEIPDTPGVRYYRVVKPEWRKVRAGISTPLRVVVLDYEWRSLFGGDVVKENLTTQPVDVRGTRADGRLTIVDPGQPAYVEFDLGGRCNGFEVGAGMATASAPGSSGQVVLIQDGVEDDFEAYNSEYSGDGGASTLITYVTGTTSLRIELRATPLPPGYTSLTRLRVFCAV